MRDRRINEGLHSVQFLPWRQLKTEHPESEVSNISDDSEVIGEGKDTMFGVVALDNADHVVDCRVEQQPAQWASLLDAGSHWDLFWMPPSKCHGRCRQMSFRHFIFGIFILNLILDIYTFTILLFKWKY